MRAAIRGGVSKLMTLTNRTCTGEAALSLIADLIRAASPLSRHLVDFPWRLSSPALQSEQDCRLWMDADGSAAGFAAWQAPWAVLDFYIRPGARQQEVEAAIFAWAAQRFRELDAERGRPLPYWMEARDDDTERLALLGRHGYVQEDSFAYVLMSCPLAAPFPPPELPPGFSIRPLGGANELDAYVSLHQRAFASTSMTAAWRARTLRMPSYRSDLDLVVTAPDGSLAGFCVGWLDAERRLAQIEPLGVDPGFQRLGLGRALLTAMLERFRRLGADDALVETETSRSPARLTYESVGFRPVQRALRKGQWFSQPSE